MIKGLVSVIIPCFNQEPFISDAMESVLKQTYENWECIVVDDGSTDQSSKFIRLYCEKDARFRLIKQINQGVTASRNIGFEKISGEFVQFLDGDDFMMPGKFEKQVDFLNSNPGTDIVYCDYLHYYQKNKKSEQYSFIDVSLDPLKMFLFYWDRGVSIPPHAPLFRRSIWSEGESPYPQDYKGRYEDWVFWIQVCLKKLTFKKMQEPLVAYRIHDSNFCSNSFNSAHNMLLAANYISHIIPEDFKTDFLLKTHQHVLNNYADNESLRDRIQHFILRLDRKKFGFLKKIALPYLLLKKSIWKS